MTNPTMNFPPSFFSDSRLNEMWAYVRYFIGYNSKLVMIIVAMIVAGMLAVLIVSIPAMAKGKRKDEDEEDDFEFY
jgi:hypothetical protein